MITDSTPAKVTTAQVTTARATTLSRDELEQAYERLAEAIDRAGPANDCLFLTKLALLLADRHGDLTGFTICLAEALADLPPQPNTADAS